MKYSRLLKKLVSKFDIRAAIYTITSLLYLWFAVSLYCIYELQTVTKSQLLIAHNRLKIVVLVAIVVIGLAYVAEYIWLYALSKTQLQSVKLKWKQKVIYVETYVHNTCNVGSFEFPIVKKHTVSKCLCGNGCLKVRRMYVYGLNYYEDARKKGFVYTPIFRLMLGVPVDYSVFRRTRKHCVTYTGYKFLLSDSKNMVCYVSKVPLCKNTVDIHILDTTNDSVKAKKQYLRATYKTWLLKWYAYMLFLFMFWLLLAVGAILQQQFWLVVLLPIITAVIVWFIRQIWAICVYELKKFLYIMSA